MAHKQNEIVRFLSKVKVTINTTMPEGDSTNEMPSLWPQLHPPSQILSLL
jgi:hypothetical protein